MDKTVKWVLLSLNLLDPVHISIRKRRKDKLPLYLGGGSVASVIRRFGDRLISDSYIYDDILIIYVE